MKYILSTMQTPGIWRDALFPPINTRLDSDPEVSPVLQRARESILLYMLRVAMIFGAVIYITALTVNELSPFLVIAYTSLLLTSIYLALTKNLPYKKRVLLGAVMLLALALTSVVSSGLSDDSRLYFLAFAMFVLIFWGTFAGTCAICLGALLLFVSGHSAITGSWSFGSSFYDHTDLTYAELIATISDWIFVCVFLTIAISILIKAMQLAWQNERASRNTVQRQSEALEESLARERDSRRQIQQQTEALEASLQRETELTDALQVSLDRERELSDMRSRIITTISHEFRTPLTIISNSLGLLDRFSDQLTSEKRNRYFANIGTSTDQLRALIEDVETVGKRNTLVNMVIPERLGMNEFCMVLIQHLINNSKTPDRIEVKSLPNFAKRKIVTDKIAVHNILHQLVDNALKFSQVPVWLTFSADEDFLQICVKDEGIGIEAKEYKRIFDLLERGTNAETIGGLGLGLYVAKQITELLEGTLDVQSPGLGHGSTFILRVPLVTKGKVPTAALP